MNESLLLGVPITVPSPGTMHETLGATNSPRGEQGASQSPAATTGVTIHHQPRTSSPLLITALSFSFLPTLPPDTFHILGLCVPLVPPSLSDPSRCLLGAKHSQG